MPYIKTTTNVKIEPTKAEHIKAKLGEAIACFPGKSEAWLMVSFDDEKKMYFKGSPEPCAISEVSIFGDVNPAASDKMSAAVTEILSEVLGISPSRIYIKYDGVRDWGWNGSNF